MNQLQKKIFGICDSRSPALILNDADIPENVVQLRQKLGFVDALQGFAGQFWTWNTESSNVRIYERKYYKIIFLSSFIQDELSKNQLAPKIKSLTCCNGLVVVVSELMKEFTFSEPIEFEKRHTVFLLALERLMSRNRKLKNITNINSGRFRKMLLETLPKVTSTYLISKSVLKNFNEIVIETPSSNGFGHGDLHPGNLLYKNNSIFYTDFESIFSRKNLAHLDFVNFARFVPQYKEHVQKKIGKKKFNHIHNSILLMNLCVLKHLELRYGQSNFHETRKFLKFI